MLINYLNNANTILNNDVIERILVKYHLDDRFSVEDIIKLLANKKKALLEDEQNVSDDNITHVYNTFPGVEVVHFCKNEVMQEEWENMGFSSSMGTVVFWEFIVQKFFEIQNIAGCEYAFLFAADSSPNMDLVNYYEVSLHFKRDSLFGTNKPLYDLLCFFMCQRINDLKEQREKFFNEFNIEPTDDVV